ncbi:MAG: bifunctional pyr operon transcriptional regulator/uracil phosphoribosyltransferase [Crocinitomicaceae bacterium]|nr:bifunctional pyr operon transcriptional regulator/uracil phosphoribosyltransferase [Crocinitomicaceae bacterium]|tara:strand:- start:196 stop:750 length:555 start_codon:yes stop_codon:yes gene_type:complete
MQKRTLLNTRAFELTVNRLCYQLIENYQDFQDAIIVGIQPRGIYLSKRIIERLKEINPSTHVIDGSLDITFYRDDFRRGNEPLTANKTEMNHLVENKKVILVDDVLFTGRSVRSAMDALLDFGRPKQVELLVLIDRRFSRHLPIQPNYVGSKIDSISSERVEVKWKETGGKDSVVLLMKKDQNE